MSTKLSLTKETANYRPTWAEISTKAFVENVRYLKRLAGERTQLIAVLKADAYGHGAAALAPLALENGASSLGVSSLEEGLSLRESGVSAPILILGGVFPLQNFAVAVEAGLTPTVASLEAAQALNDMAAEEGRVVGFHLKIDTGMGRIGTSVNGAHRLLERLGSLKSIRLEGIYSHFACADSDPDFTAKQLALFLELKNDAARLGLRDVAWHIANSAALLTAPASRLDAVRPGIALYGLSPVPSAASSLKPVLSWHTKIVFLKKVQAGTSISYGRAFVAPNEMEIATLPVGYADGVPRAVAGKASVLVRGEKRPVLGRVTMDHIMVDVTGLGADVGEPVALIGRQGDQILTADDWAGWAGTISYEILCGISKRVPRVIA